MEDQSMMVKIRKKILAVQQECPTLTKDTDGVHGSKYATLEQVIGALKPLLKKHKLAVTQLLATTQTGLPALQTVIMDTEDDGSIASQVPLPEGLNAQQMGSAITYLKRYSLVAAFLMQAEVDDDGLKATNSSDEPW